MLLRRCFYVFESLKQLSLKFSLQYQHISKPIGNEEKNTNCNRSFAIDISQCYCELEVT